MVLLRTFFDKRIEHNHPLTFHEIFCINGKKNSSVLIVSQRHTHLIEFRFFQTLDKFRTDYVFCKHNFKYIVILFPHFLGKALIVFIKFFRVCCLSYSFFHAAKVIYLFHSSKFFGRKILHFYFFNVQCSIILPRFGEPQRRFGGKFRASDSR